MRFVGFLIGNTFVFRQLLMDNISVLYMYNRVFDIRIIIFLHIYIFLRHH